ncbi:hypothetical protein G9A89_011477 [Geosiphon pyriformis]|nr:hypothetical protein G9A89_011477 [Geosiphon pyriformis]
MQYPELCNIQKKREFTANKHQQQLKKETKNLHKNNFKVATTPDTTTLEYYQSIYTHCKQKFNIPGGIEVVKKSLGTEDFNSETFAIYFHELNFNIIKYCEETYPVHNKGKNKLKQYSRTTPNTPTLLKTTAKHLQTPEQGTSSKFPLTITPFPALLAQAQIPNSPLNRFVRPEDFTSLRSPTRQQEPFQTSSNLLDFLAENQSEHSETAANEENDFEITKKESIDSENEENEMTTYIAKIPKFNGEDIETSLQKWLDQVIKAGDTNGWNAARMLRTIPYFLKGTAGEWFENLAFTNNNISITLRNCFQNIKQEPSESIHPHVPEDLNSAIQHVKRYEMAMEEANRTKLVNLAIGETSSTAEEKINQLTKKVENYFTN